jgi:hypothetical protein
VYRFADAITGIGAQLESENDALFEKCNKIAKHKRAALKRQFRDEWRSTALALYLQHRESKVIEETIDILAKRGVTVVGNIHNSVIVPASCNVDVELINDAVCEKFNLEFKFNYKEFEKDQEWYSTLVEGIEYNDNMQGDPISTNWSKRRRLRVVPSAEFCAAGIRAAISGLHAA